MEHVQVTFSVPRPHLQWRHLHRLRSLLPTPGNVLFTFLVIGSLLWAQQIGALTLWAAPNTAAISPSTIAYQGRLANSAGVMEQLPPTGTIALQSALFRQPVTRAYNTLIYSHSW
ncbi:MAG: hypothetical protein R3E79_32840 [Caldilineaceae bacterium]